MKTKSYFKIDTKGRIVSHTNRGRNTAGKQIDISAIGIGYYIITPLLVGVFIGLVIDNRFHSQPKGVLIGIAVGFISTIYNLIKLTKENAGN